MRRLIVYGVAFWIIMLTPGIKCGSQDAMVYASRSPVRIADAWHRNLDVQPWEAYGRTPLAMRPSLQELMQSSLPLKPHPCIRIVAFDATTQDAADGFGKMAWTAHILNICSHSLPVRIILIIRDQQYMPLEQDVTDAVLQRYTTSDTRGSLIMPLDDIWSIVQYELHVAPY